jgi:hypothetical protein
VQRLTWWSAKIGTLRLDQVSDDHVHVALEELAAQPPRSFAGADVDGRPCLKQRRNGSRRRR